MKVGESIDERRREGEGREEESQKTTRKKTRVDEMAIKFMLHIRKEDEGEEKIGDEDSKKKVEVFY